MNKALLVLLCFFVSIQYSTAQALKSTFQAGGPGNDHIRELKSDNNGNLYSLGYFESSITIGNHTLVSAADRSYFIAKHTPQGEVLWAKEVAKAAGSGAIYYASGLHVNDEGFITLTGGYLLGVDFDAGTLTGTDWNIFYTCFDTYGENLWVRSLGGPEGEETGTDITVDKAGNIYLGGNVKDNIQIGAFTARLRIPMAFIAKINPAGEVQWLQHSTYNEEWVDEYLEYGTSLYDLPSVYFRDVAVSMAGDVIVAADILYQEAWHGTDIYSYFEFTTFLKFSNNGEFLSEELFPKAGNDYFSTYAAMDTDIEGNIYLTGRLDIGPYSDGKLYVYKMGKNGWLATVGTTNTENWYPYFDSSGQDVHVTDDGRIYVTGHMSSTPVIFDDIFITPKGTDPFIAELSADGKWLWAKNFEASFFGQHLSSDTAGNLYLAGRYTESLNLSDTTLTGQGKSDIFYSIWNVQETASLPGGSVYSFMLVSAETNSDWWQIKNNDVIYLDNAPPRFTIRAAVSPKVTSVKFTLNGRRVRIENQAPYALAGDRNGNYHPLKLEPGHYTLTATPYSQPNGKGEKGQELTIRFEVKEEYIPPSGKVKSFTLVDANTNQDIQEIKYGDVLYMDQLPANLNIRVNTLPERVSYVTVNFNDTQRIEHVPPYAVAGDRDGNYHAISPRLSPGYYSLYATSTILDTNRQAQQSHREYLCFQVIERQTASSQTAEKPYSTSTQLVAFPNPFTQQINLEVNVQEPSTIVLEVFDLQGRLISTLFKGWASPDQIQSFMFDGSTLPAGVYLGKLSTGRSTHYQKLLLNK